MLASPYDLPITECEAKETPWPSNIFEWIKANDWEDDMSYIVEAVKGWRRSEVQGPT